MDNFAFDLPRTGGTKQEPVVHFDTPKLSNFVKVIFNHRQGGTGTEPSGEWPARATEQDPRSLQERIPFSAPTAGKSLERSPRGRRRVSGEDSNATTSGGQHGVSLILSPTGGRGEGLGMERKQGWKEVSIIPC